MAVIYTTFGIYCSNLNCRVVFLLISKQISNRMSKNLIHNNVKGERQMRLHKMIQNTVLDLDKNIMNKK